ncbi:hypothetical protein Leryth_014816 [Lithospermum erythrorhizon]|nr:hypothetical protein Leryth_014816 [Lithospermum erythrorhizon]
MASNTLATSALLITFNLLFFTLVSSTSVPCPPPPPKKCGSCHKTPTKPSPTPSKGTPTKPSPTPSKGTPTKPPPTPSKGTPTTPAPTPTTPSPTPTTPSPTCPKDALKLGVCADLLGGLVNVVVGSQSNTPCCTLLGGLADLDAAVCLCTAIKANVLGINLNVPVSLSLLLNYCGKKSPSGFQCN